MAHNAAGDGGELPAASANDVAGGTVPRHSMVAHNLDLSGYATLLDRTYRTLAEEMGEDQLAAQLPFCVFQHAMVEYLNTYLILHQKQEHGDPRLGAPAFEEISALRANFGGMLVPAPIRAYVTGIGTVVSPTGDVLRVNLPVVAIPRAGGSFGPATAGTHNVYECYWSPLVTHELIRRTLEVNVARMNGEGDDNSDDSDDYDDDDDDDDTSDPFGAAWNPLPAGAFPTGCVATPNLLGYHRPQSLPALGVRLLQSIMTEQGGFAGRLRHSRACLNGTSNLLRRTTNLFVSVNADFVPQPDRSLLLFKRNVTRESPHRRLADFNATIGAPFAADASLVRRAHYFGYRRKRSGVSSGPCFVTATRGEVPQDWLDSRNDNFKCVGAFEPSNGMSRRNWLTKIFHETLSDNGLIARPIGEYVRSVFVRVQAENKGNK